jgi:benzoate/toluate 1,2-dioxygenase reductase component
MMANAAYIARINISLDCRDGACGTCKCQVQSGRYDGGSYTKDALTDEEAAEALALACQMRPQSDCVRPSSARPRARRTKRRSLAWSGSRPRPSP